MSHWQKASNNLINILKIINPSKRTTGRVDFLWRALDSYNKAFRFLTKMPLDFDVKRRRMIKISKLSVIFPWLFMAYGVAGLSSCVVKIIQVFYVFFLPLSLTGMTEDQHKEFSDLIQVLSIPLVIALAGSSPVIGVFMFLYGNETIRTINSLLILEELVEKRSNLRKPRKHKPSASQEIFALILSAAPYVTLALAPILIGFGCFQNADPLYFGLKVLLGIQMDWRKKTIKTLLIWIARFLIFLMSSVEVMRLIIALGLMFIILIWVIICCLFFIDQEYSETVSFGPKLIPLRQYNTIHVAICPVKPPQNSIALFMLGGVAGALVLLITLTFGFYDKLPFNVYMLAPITSVIILVIVHLIIPKIITIRRMSVEMLRKWKMDRSIKQNGLYFNKLVRATRPQEYYLGLQTYQWYLINREFKVNYYYMILDNSTLVLMSLNL